MRRAGILVVAGLLGVAVSGIGVLAQAPTCSKVDFEAVVDEAAGALTELTRQNTPPLVRDDKIAGFDQKSEDLLLRITSGGQSGAADGPPDCKLVAELRAVMQSLLETQKAKWAYMFEKIEAELRK
jgi:hypothetical protein